MNIEFYKYLYEFSVLFFLLLRYLKFIGNIFGINTCVNINARAHVVPSMESNLSRTVCKLNVFNWLIPFKSLT